MQSTREPERAMSTATSDTAHKSASSDAASSDMKHILSQYWWLIALRGVLGIGFGIIALAMPVATILALVLLFSAYMLADGAFTLYAAYQAARQGKKWGLLVLQGLANLVVGILAVFWPGITVLAFILMLAAWALISGCLQIAAAFRVSNGRWWLAIGGVVSIIWSALLVVAPSIGAVVLTWWMGAWAIVFGAFLVVAAFRLRSLHDQSPSVGKPQPAA
jgi:uncharacterized membrane protein HdeD (DUF308 family)